MNGPASGRGGPCATGALAPQWERHPIRKLTGKLLRPGGLALTEHGLSLCGFSRGARLLDLGCGLGATLGLLHGLGFACLGLDRSSAVLQEARAHAFCLQADMARLPLADAALDGIVCECVLSLAEDKAAVLGECRRTLHAGGRLLLCDMARSAEQAFAPARSPSPCVLGAPSRAAWLALLKGAGFTVLHEEDQTGQLRSLAARIAWEFGSLDALAGLWSAGQACGPSPGPRPGYFLFVAEAV